MCGIVGLLAKADRPLGKGDLTEVSSAVQALADVFASGQGPAEVRACAERLEALSQRAVNAATVWALLRGEDPVQDMAEWETEAVGRAAESGGEEGEAWNRVAVLLLDARWRLTVDLPEIAAWVRETAEAVPTQMTDAGRIRLFHLAVTLRSVDRLEVRGRDSAGLVTVFTFPDPEARDAFEGEPFPGAEGPPLAERMAIPDLAHRAVVRAAGPPGRPCLAFAHKVAEEIGALGQNVSALTAALRADRAYLALLNRPDVPATTLAHTRWASNGIINEENCHPVDSRFEGDDVEKPVVFAVLNGDIDNYPKLCAELEAEGVKVPASITTDAKIIPLVTGRAMAGGLDFPQAFREAVSRFEGSFAVAALCSADPTRLLLAQRGSGQALYLGETEECFLCVSEIYGLVEIVDAYRKMEDRPQDPGCGTVLMLKGGAEPARTAVDFQGCSLDMGPTFAAAITTRDIHRGDFDHYFLKEITESPDSFAKTLRGKYRIEETGSDGELRPVFTISPETVPPDVLRRMGDGSIRRVVFIGQGTASIAGQGMAVLFEKVFGPGRFQVSAIKASELSGFGLRGNMEDTLVVAVSQSGTTTDTNRTVDLARKRGASVLAILNRRNADLVDKAHGVLYTSDGRDVEMSVASTKAFYAQVGAGYLLALYLAHSTGVLGALETTRRLSVLERIPHLMRQTLAEKDKVRRVAEEFALLRRHWAVVGSGLDKVAAEEVRIKLSELNYKSISCDVTEDKKHIDLSAEPLILLCATSLSEANLTDIVKETSIFRAHRACPIVIAPEGERAFDAHAAAVLEVHSGGGDLSFLLGTMVGHLWGYYAARAIDESARVLRTARAAVVLALPELRRRSGFALAQTAGMLARQVASHAQTFRDNLWRGRFNAGLGAETAARLLTLFQYASGRIKLFNVRADFGIAPRWDELHGAFLRCLSGAIGELTRPIDAIKHQAKTVTVGISREQAHFGGILFEKLGDLGIASDAVDYPNQAALAALSEAVAEVSGHTRYTVKGLDDALRPDDRTLIAVQERDGLASEMVSRYEEPRKLAGTKAAVLARGRVFVGTGRRDGRTIVIVPTVVRDPAGDIPLVLFHVRFHPDMSLDDKVKILRSCYERYEEIRWAVGEIKPGFTDAWLAAVPIIDLLAQDPDVLAERIVEGVSEEGK